MKNLIPHISTRNIIRSWLALWGIYLLLLLVETCLGGSLTLWRVMTLLFSVDVVSTVPVFVLFYQGKTKDSAFNPIWIVYTCISAWAIYLLCIVSGGFIASTRAFAVLISISTTIGRTLILPSLVIAFLGLINPRNSKKNDRRTVSRLLVQTIASFIVLALIIGTYAAIHTLWLSPEQGKFIYNNLANGLCFGSLGLIILLSYLQRDVYWINRGRLLRLDERQIQERQRAFETSYKIGTALVFIAAYELYSYEHTIPMIVRNDSMTPGDMLLPFVNLALTLFALPLLVAAYKRRAK